MVVNRDLMDGILSHAERARSSPPPEGNGDDRPKAKGFPIHALPDGMRRLAEHLHTTIGFPLDYASASMLFAASVAVGTTVRISPKDQWTEPAVLWLALVGRPGANKTHPLTWALRPLVRQDRESASRYEVENKAYEDALKRSRKEKEGDVEVPPEPVCGQHLVSDTTPEALVEALHRNPRGIGLHRDELAGWVEDFGRYSKGGDAERFLSMWSLQPVFVNRVKTKRPRRVERPFVSVCGTIQPGVLGRLVADGRGVNGFIDRILFAYPEAQLVPEWSEQEPEPQASSYWQSFIAKLLSVPTPADDAEPLLLTFSPEAKELWTRHYAHLKSEIDAHNLDGDETRAGHRTKMVSYTLRLALVDALARWAESGSHQLPAQVDATSLAAAIELSGYFTSTADKVLFALHESTPADRLAGNGLRLFDALPPEFRTGDAVTLAQQQGGSERTTKRLLNRWTREGLLNRDGRGRYTKRFER